MQVFLAFRAAKPGAAEPMPAVFLDQKRPLPIVAKIIERDQKATQQRLSETGRKGKLVYESLCIACHGPDGRGVITADKLLAPPLAKSTWFADGGHLPALGRILLKGQTGPIDGVTYGEGLMIPLEKTHSDEQIAQVLSYIGELWHGWTRPAEAREIAQVRKSVTDRQQPWTHDELVAWQQARAKNFHPIAFGEAANADGRKGLYLATDAPSDRVSLRKYGTAQINGVPFTLPDPATTPGGKNVIVLKGGAEPKAISLALPQSVDIPVNQPAGRLHLLGAVGGWGWNAIKEKIPVVAITIHYQGGASEKIELVNGIEIADHVSSIDVPGSVRTSLVSKGQMRYLWRDLKQPGKVVERITLSSYANAIAPLVAGLTMESPGSDGRLGEAPVSGGAVVGQGK
jgi:mono/diheme cytochrome c family protein